MMDLTNMSSRGRSLVSHLTVMTPLALLAIYSMIPGNVDVSGGISLIAIASSVVLSLVLAHWLAAAGRSENESNVSAEEASRLRSALDSTTTNVMVADEDLNIVYMNNTVREMMRSAQTDICRDLPGFDVDSLLGTNIDSFHKDPAHQRRLLATLNKTFESRLSLGGRTFRIIANPIKDDAGSRLGTVVEWSDLTDSLAREAEERQHAAAREELALENARIRQALDSVSTNVMVADEDLNIVYLNDTVKEMLRAAQADIRKDLPQFNVDNLLGMNIDGFHRDPGHQRSLLAGLRKTFKSQLSLGDRTLQIIANPVFDEQNQRLGTVVEWADLTQEIAVEKEVAGIVEAIVGGDLETRISLADKSDFFETLAHGINGLVDNVAEVVDEVQRLVESANEGDLTLRMQLDGKAGLFRRIGGGINQLTGNMSEIVSRVKTAALEVHRGSEEISQGNTNLSQRTEEQASSLEETASSMEQMTSTVKQTADNASQANQLAIAARDQAERGGSVVLNAVEAMTEISAASNKITDIIGVIDEIAFQTNLLALNAAVEAARAGEQGRGFAVVASEVRSLAGRSASAAKQIKELIQDSVKKVEEGNSLVTQSGETLEQIVGAVKKVTDIVAEIAAASQEQSAGIEQVNKAVMQLDELTQQNAALVEEASAASQSMADQSRGLNQMMNRYKVSEETPVLSNRNREAARSEGTLPPTEERRRANRPWAPAAAPGIDQAKVAIAATGTQDDEWEEF